MACVSACGKLKHGRIQMGDGKSKPGKVNLATAPGLPDGAYEVHGAFRAWPARACLRDCNPARERSTSDTSRLRGRRECRWRVMCEFGADGSACGRVCEAPHAAHRVFCLWNARSRFLGLYARAGLHRKQRRFGARVTSLGTSRHEGQVNSACCPAWRNPRKRALVAISGVMTRPQVSSDGRDK